MATFRDAFISYSRADSKAFVISLKERLKAAGLARVWLDQDDIPSATDWQQRIDGAIERSHNFIYVISPTAIASTYCQLELSLAIQYGKRIIPLMHVEGGDRQTWQQQDPQGCATIRQLNWIFFRSDRDDPDQAFRKLCHALRCCDEQTGQEQAHIKAYVHQHTALLAQALTWDRHHRQNRYLLVGSERQAAETWLQTRFAEGESLPCTPTNLHCEFITESIKNASNLMTQVFLCHSDDDQEIAEQIRRSLLRQGITVWNYRTDIQTSQDYNSAITGGIEEADNMLFLLSPQSAQSPYCQRELQQALDLHKRVIPVLAAPTEPELVPESLRPLQYVDLTDNSQPSDYLADESQLLKLLGTDAAYHTEHKTWLVQALKWQRQQQNPTLLLRGYNLRQAENWLKVARTHRHPPTALHEQFIAESLRQPPDASLDVFISYSRVDSDFARRLNDALQTQGKRTWFDQESIATGTDFQQEIYRGIESSDVFVFVLSPEAVTSPFCADEVEYAQGLNKRMVTVLHRPVDTADLHPVLAKLQWLDFREHDGDFQANFAGLLRTLDTDREHLETHTRLLVRSGEWDRRGRDESLLLRGQDLQTAETWLTTNAKVEPLPTGLQQEYIRASRAREESKQKADNRLKRGALIGTLAATVGILIALASGLTALSERRRANEISGVANWTEASTNQRDLGSKRRDLLSEFRVRNADQKVTQAEQQQKEAENKAKAAETRASEANKELTRVQSATNLVRKQINSLNSQIIAANSQLETEQEKIRLLRKGSDLEREATFIFRSFERLKSPSNRAGQLAQLISTVKVIKRLEKITQPDTNLVEYPAISPISTLEYILQAIMEKNRLEHEESVNASAFSYDGRKILTGSKDGKATLWNSNGNIIRQFQHQGPVNAVALSRDSRKILTGSEDGKATLWDSEGNIIRQFQHQDSVNSIVLSVDEKELLTGSGNLNKRTGAATLWSLNGDVSTQYRLNRNDTVTSVAFSSSNNLILIGTGNLDRCMGCGTVTLYRHDGQLISEVQLQNIVTDVSFNPDDNDQIMASTNGFFGFGEAIIWDINLERIGEPVTQFKHEIELGINSAIFSPDGRRLLTGSVDKVAIIWDLNRESYIEFNHKDQIRGGSFSPNGQQVLTGSSDNTAALWNIDGKLVRSFLHKDWVSSVSFSPNGQQVLTGSWDKTAAVWNIDGKLVRSFLHKDAVTSVSFSPNGQHVLTGSWDNTATLWNVNGDLVVQLPHEDTVWSVAFSPNGQKLVTGSIDGKVNLWNLKGKKLAQFEHKNSQIEERNKVRSVAFSPDGNKILTGSSDGTVILWSFDGEHIAEFQHKSEVWDVSFSPDGKQILTGGLEGTTLWSLDGKHIAEFQHESEVWSVSFSPDGKQFLSTEANGTATLQPIPTIENLLARSCKWLRDYLAYNPTVSNEDQALCQ